MTELELMVLKIAAKATKQAQENNLKSGIANVFRIGEQKWANFFSIA